MNREDKINIIEKFFKNTLTNSEQEEFDKLIKSDEEFKDIFDAEQLLLEAIIKDDLSKKFNEFKDFSETDPKEIESKSFSIKPFIFSKLGIAASILFLIVSIGYGAHVLGLIDLESYYQRLFNKNNPNTELEKEPKAPMILEDERLNSKDTTGEANANDVDTVVNEMKIDTVTDETSSKKIDNVPKIEFQFVDKLLDIPLNENSTVSIGTDFKITFFKETFVKGKNQANHTKIHYKEILNANNLKQFKNNSKVLKVFKLNLANLDEKLEVNNLAPIMLEINNAQKKDGYKVFYGGNGKNVLEWSEYVFEEEPFIETPTKLMSDYQSYKSSLELMDSIKTHYYQTNVDFELRNDPKIRISREFVLDRMGFISKYESDPHFESNVENAKKQWDTYWMQREIAISKDTFEFERETIMIDKLGWFAIVSI